MNNYKDIKSDRLNDEVALFMGCTLKETLGVILVAMSIGIVIGVPVSLIIFGSFTIGLALSLIFGAITVFPLIIRLSKLKRGKPGGYYQQYLRMKLVKIGLIKSPYILRSGKWSTMRVVK